MLATTGLHTRHSRLGCSNRLCHLRLRESLRRTGLQKLLQKREFIGQLIKLGLDLRVLQRFAT